MQKRHVNANMHDNNCHRGKAECDGSKELTAAMQKLKRSLLDTIKRINQYSMEGLKGSRQWDRLIETSLNSVKEWCGIGTE